MSVAQQSGLRWEGCAKTDTCYDHTLPLVQFHPRKVIATSLKDSKSLLLRPD